MTELLLIIAIAVAVWLRVRMWRIGYHTRQRDRHDARAWRLMRGGR
jgi:hypothetical protein